MSSIERNGANIALDINTPDTTTSKNNKLRIGRRGVGALLASSVLATGVGAGNRLSSANANFRDGQPPLGTLINPGWISETRPLTPSDIKYCQKLTVGLNSKPDRKKSLVFFPGIVYGETVKKLGKSVRITLRLADIPIDGGVTNRAYSKDLLFAYSCEQVATDTDISLDLVEKTDSGSIKTIKRDIEGEEGLRLEDPGYKGQDYTNEIHGRGKLGLKGLPLSSPGLERHTSTTPLPSKDSDYGIRTRLVVKPADPIEVLAATSKQATNAKTRTSISIKRSSRIRWIK